MVASSVARRWPGGGPVARRWPGGGPAVVRWPGGLAVARRWPGGGPGVALIYLLMNCCCIVDLFVDVLLI